LIRKIGSRRFKQLPGFIANSFSNKHYTGTVKALDFNQGRVQIGLTLLACLVVGSVQGYFSDWGYAVPIAYSVAIGGLCVCFIQIGAYFAMPKSPRLVWQEPKRWMPIVFVSLVLGFVVGVSVVDRFFGWSTWDNARVLKTSLAISLACTLVFCTVFYSLGKSQSLEAELEEVQRLEAQTRLKLLESQLDPHMLFNTLSNLRAMIALDPGKAQVMLDHMTDFLRASLSGSRASQHSLDQEFARLRDYLSLMQIRMGSRLQFSLELPSELRDISIPSLLLQPLVENAIKHGLEPKKAGGQLRVCAAKQNGRLQITIQDDGLGYEPTRRPDQLGGGFGLQQVRERLHVAYGERASLNIEALQPGCLVAIALPEQI
jgi:hypothetical protein